MTGMDFETHSSACARRRCKPLKLGGKLHSVALVTRMRISAGVQLHNRRTERNSGPQLRNVCIDKQRHPDANICKARHKRFEVIMLSGGIKPALSRHFLASFRHDANRMGAMTQRNGKHFFGRCHFKIKRQIDLAHQTFDVMVTDVATVFAQMRRDAIGTGSRCHFRCPHRIGMIPAARVTNGGNMINVDAETQICGRMYTHSLTSGSDVASRSKIRASSFSRRLN